MSTDTMTDIIYEAVTEGLFLSDSAQLMYRVRCENAAKRLAPDRPRARTVQVKNAWQQQSEDRWQARMGERA
jgi:hypothetical protein